MRILYVSKASRVAAHREKLRLLAERVEVTLVTPDRWGSTPWEPAPFDEGLEIRRRPTFLHGHNHLHFYRPVGGVLQAGDFDLVHADEEPYSLVTHQLTGRARRSGVPSLFFAWQNLDKHLPLPFSVLRRRVFRRVAGGIAGTSEAAEVLRSAGFGGPLLVSPQMGVSTERFRPSAGARAARRRELGLEEDASLIGFVGRLVREKGVDLLVRALSSLPGAHLVLVGDGPREDPLRRLAARSEVAGRVHVVGSVPSLEVPGWTAALDVLALPSRTTQRWKEQFGRAVVEAMACEVPVVVSDSGALPEVVGATGWVVPQGSTEALAEALADALEAPRDGRDGRGPSARAGRIRVLEHFRDRTVVDQQVEFYGRLLRGGGVDASGRASP